ncbi:MAG: hypothetical protein Q9170_004695 [Blastenia crenularia]
MPGMIGIAVESKNAFRTVSVLLPTALAFRTSLASVNKEHSLLRSRNVSVLVAALKKLQQICNKETLAIGRAIGMPYGDPSDLRVACSPEFRSADAGCEAATCNSSEYQNTQLLAQQLCGSLYNSNATLSSSVSAAIASATAAAKAATEGKDPTDLSVFPACGQTCIPQDNYHGCGSSSNLLCICQGIQFNNAINPCERSLCSPADLQTIVFLAEKLCEPVGGVLTNPINYTGSASNTTTNGSSPPTVPFTGEATNPRGNGLIGMIVVGVAVGLGLLVL